MKCSFCTKEIHGSYITVIIDAVEHHFCDEQHMRKYFQEQNRKILEEYEKYQKTLEQK